jgi:hypothetical protein
MEVAMTIKARREYMTKPGYGVKSEVVRVLGHETLTVATQDDEGGWNGTPRIERWCRVRFVVDGRGPVLIHPSNLVEIPA